MTRLSELQAMADVALVRSTAGKAGLSPEMCLLLSLVIFDGYEIGGGEGVTSNILARARNVGTYNALNRAAQYSNAEPREVLRAVNEAWTKIRALENSLTQRDAKIAELRSKLRRFQLVNVTLTAIITSLAFKGLELLFQALR